MVAKFQLLHFSSKIIKKTIISSKWLYDCHECAEMLILINGLLIFHKETKRRKEEGYVLFNDALNTFYLRLYGVRHMVKDHSDSERKSAAATWATLSD